MKKSHKQNQAIPCQTLPKNAESCQIMPPPDHDWQPGPIGLNTNQQRALVALLEAPSVAAAARSTGIGERTLHRWLHEDPEFQTALRRTREHHLTHAATRLQSTAQQAVQALVELLASKDRIEPGRAALIRTALDFAFRAGSYTDLAERLEELEAAAAQEKAYGKTRNPSARDSDPQDGDPENNDAEGASLEDSGPEDPHLGNNLLGSPGYGPTR